MTELICSQGHVIDPGLSLCARCNGAPIGQAEVAPVINEEVASSSVDLESLTKKEIEAELTKLGVDFKTSESKAELLEKLKESAEASAEDVEDVDADEDSNEDESDEDSDSEDDEDEA